MQITRIPIVVGDDCKRYATIGNFIARVTKDVKGDAIDLPGNYEMHRKNNELYIKPSSEYTMVAYAYFGQEDREKIMDVVYVHSFVIFDFELDGKKDGVLNIIVFGGPHA